VSVAAASIPALREAVARRALSRGSDGALDDAVARFGEAAGDSLDGLVFFGSRRTGAALANAWSAYDLFVLVGDYRPFYEAMARAGISGKSPGPLAVLSRCLPPTQYSIRFRKPDVHLKTAVIRTDTFHRETSPRRRDHFCIGRLFQPSRILVWRSEAVRDALVDDLVAAHALTFEWVRPWLPPAFDGAAYGRAALAVSMSWEVRPEPAGRALTLWEAQAAEQTPVFEALLRDLGERGEVTRDPDGHGWRLSRAVGWREREALKLYFRRSIVRATARWLKHVLSFEGWLDYIVHKASRHSGETIELTERERRWPWLFAWGRFFRYLRSKNDRGSSR
jgi:hypothetical protein